MAFSYVGGGGVCGFGSTGDLSWGGVVGGEVSL